MTEISLNTSKREQFVDITAQLAALVRESGISRGVLRLHCPHTTAGLTVNENADPDVTRDLLTTLDRLIPRQGDYRHAEGNSDAHLKASLMGCHLTLLVEDGRLALGTWQGVYFCEFDGPRHRGVWARVEG
ncbi:secondary thiamine-phosphate synthase enzyme YjbQ [Fundidesulfovibrio butyratiphilus]